MANIIINEGTQTAIPIDLIGTVHYPITKIDIGAAGISAPFTGTLLGGTINNGTTNMVNGTLNVGTINNGTVLTTGIAHPLSFNTVFSTGTTTLGTIISAAGAGTKIYITDIIVSVGTLATNVVIANGTVTSPLIGTLSFAANGGMVSNFRTPIATGTNGTLVIQQSVGIPLNVTVTGWTGA